MPKLLGFVLALLLLVVVGGAIYIAVWDVPPPVRTVEKVLPADALQK